MLASWNANSPSITGPLWGNPPMDSLPECPVMQSPDILIATWIRFWISNRVAVELRYHDVHIAALGILRFEIRRRMAKLPVARIRHKFVSQYASYFIVRRYGLLKSIMSKTITCYTYLLSIVAFANLMVKISSYRLERAAREPFHLPVKECPDFPCAILEGSINFSCNSTGLSPYIRGAVCIDHVTGCNLCWRKWCTMAWAILDRVWHGHGCYIRRRAAFTWCFKTRSILTQWGWDKTFATSQTIFPHAFSWLKILYFD